VNWTVGMSSLWSVSEATVVGKVETEKDGEIDVDAIMERKVVAGGKWLRDVGCVL
jgi:hypothetical protein